MIKEVEKYKGIHPGAVLERELKKRNLAQRPFAMSISEYPQSLNAITKGKRGMNTTLALKIEEALGLEEGTFMLLQVFYDINGKAKGFDPLPPNKFDPVKSLITNPLRRSIKNGEVGPKFVVFPPANYYKIGVGGNRFYDKEKIMGL